MVADHYQSMSAATAIKNSCPGSHRTNDTLAKASTARGRRVAQAAGDVTTDADEWKGNTNVALREQTAQRDKGKSKMTDDPTQPKLDL